MCGVYTALLWGQHLPRVGCDLAKSWQDRRLQSERLTWSRVPTGAFLRGAGEVAEVLPPNGCRGGPGRAGSAGHKAAGGEAAGGTGQPRHCKQGREPSVVQRREPGHERTPARTWLSAPSTVDLLDWNRLFDSRTKLSRPLLIPNRKTGQLEPLLSRFSEEEELQMKRVLQRMDVLARRAMEKGVRLMVDAEQSYFQPAISRLTVETQRRFNKSQPLIYNTYQCYLREAYNNVTGDVELSRQEGWHFGTKLVRGAYMEQERERAAQMGYEDPINPTYEKTNEMYHRCLDYVLEEIKQRRKASVMVATHNEDTVKFTLRRMMELGIHPSDKKVCFGQLLGMCDQITFPLGQAGFPVYKYVPYGPVNEVLPYLSRRAQENRGFMQRANRERDLLWKEVKRRLLSGNLFSP
ncbi:proline dehydrogenase 1, mitochondrial-like isoform X1 [Camarhynchus parvulus]|uniref:proline dehydrogenase 1, mitochondrial-like isoform X1 n=1 Tax=Geospiza parvula TaxID=87175 RepID=UPI001237D679|nr:proline dehydrogenase 1, mitochondrial-like isoform X1 [Camarhynchus parvulus]